MECYYTYAYLREDGTPYYIGKGSGGRAYSCRNRAIKRPSDPSRILILKENLTEEEAFRHEIYMIFVFGRKINGTGILRNQTDGGEGPSGYRHTTETLLRITEKRKERKTRQETRDKMSKTRRGRPSHNKGKKWWTHPSGQTTLSSEQPGPEWVEGKPDHHTGRKWWVNESGECVQTYEKPGPEWKPGRKWK